MLFTSNEFTKEMLVRALREKNIKLFGTESQVNGNRTEVGKSLLAVR